MSSRKPPCEEPIFEQIQGGCRQCVSIIAPNQRAVNNQFQDEVTTELYGRIRRLWIDHSCAEDARDLEGLIATLAEDCVYEVVPTGQRWQGHDGARRFYTTFLGAFPDVSSR
jgi:hypothetical protein